MSLSLLVVPTVPGNDGSEQGLKRQQRANYCTVQFSSVQSLSCARLFVTPWTAALQACAIAQNQTKPPPQPVETSTWSRREAWFFWHQLVPALLLCQQSRCLHSSRNPVLCGGECIFVRVSTRARPTPHRGVDLL